MGYCPSHLKEFHGLPVHDALVQRLRETLEPHGVDLVLTPVRRRGHCTGARYVAVGE
jgi:hypothetical protein